VHAALSEEERRSILQSDAFLEFFDKSTKIVERALNEPFDILIDYAAAQDDDLYAAPPSRAARLL